MKDSIKNILKIVFVTLACLWGIVLVNDLFQDWRFKRQWVKDLKEKQERGFSPQTRALHYSDTTDIDTLKTNE